MDAMLDQRQGKLALELHDMEQYLSKVRYDLRKNNETSISHLNTRLFLQVHVTNVIEASQEYDQAVTAYLAAKQTERQSGAHN